MASCDSFINITINISGRSWPVNLPKNFSLADFKKIFKEKFGIDDVDNCRYICKGKELNIHDETAFNSRKHLITDKVTIYICKQLTGGGGLGVDFVDLSNTNGLSRRQWSHRAPEWRWVAYGLCLEGKCNNNSCKAYQRQVIVKIGFGKFDLLKDPVDTSKCPICSKYVDPITCAFNNCRWRWHGIKQTQPGSPPEKISADWKIADNAYHVFDQNISGMTVWRELIIETERT